MKKYNITREDYRMMEIVIIENKPYKAGPQWVKFAAINQNLNFTSDMFPL